jgi:hypothetical protein
LLVERRQCDCICGVYYDQFIVSDNLFEGHSVRNLGRPPLWMWQAFFFLLYNCQLRFTRGNQVKLPHNDYLFIIKFLLQLISSFSFIFFLPYLNYEETRHNFFFLQINIFNRCIKIFFSLAKWMLMHFWWCTHCWRVKHLING